MLIQICVGSSCHLNGSEELISLFQTAVQQSNLEAEITLAGSFCTGKCNREGVTVSIDDKIFTGVTPAGFYQFFEEYVKKPLLPEKE